MWRVDSLQQIALELDCREQRRSGIGWLECDTGAPRTAVIFHGVTGGKMDMLPIMRAYARCGYAVYAIDLPGHGGADFLEAKSFDDLAGWCDRALRRICRTPDVIVANSYSSSLLYWYMCRGFLPTCTRVILGCPVPRVSWLSNALHLLSVRAPERFFWPIYNSSGIRVARTALLLSSLDRSAWAWTLESERRKEQYTSQRAANTLTELIYRRNPFETTLPEDVQRRVTVVMGENDLLVNRRSRELMHQLLPCSLFRSVPHAGHLLQFEAWSRLLPE